MLYDYRHPAASGPGRGRTVSGDRPRGGGSRAVRSKEGAEEREGPSVFNPPEEPEQVEDALQDPEGTRRGTMVLQWEPHQGVSEKGTGGAAAPPRDSDRISLMSGRRTTPLGDMLGFLVPATRATLICDEWFINWPLPDELLQVKFFSEDWMTLGAKLHNRNIVLDTDLVVLAVATTNKVAKNTVVT